MGIISVGLKLARFATKKPDEKKQDGEGKPAIVPPSKGGAEGEPERRPDVGESPFKYPAGSPRPEPLYGNDHARLDRNYLGSLGLLPRKMLQSDSVEPLASFFVEALKNDSLGIDPSLHRRVAEMMATSDAVNTHIIVTLADKEIRYGVIPVLASLPDGDPRKNVLSAFAIAAKKTPDLYSYFFKVACNPIFKETLMKVIRAAKKEQDAVHLAKQEQAKHLSPKEQNTKDDHLIILKTRFAKGEITEEEFMRMKTLLE
jgi:hypothetical protein